MKKAHCAVVPSIPSIMSICNHLPAAVKQAVILLITSMNVTPELCIISSTVLQLLGDDFTGSRSYLLQCIWCLWIVSTNHALAPPPLLPPFHHSLFDTVICAAIVSLISSSQFFFKNSTTFATGCSCCCCCYDVKCWCWRMTLMLITMLMHSHNLFNHI